MRKTVIISTIVSTILISIICVAFAYRPYSGYHIYGYIAGDENHTIYEDTIIWGNLDTAEAYFDSINKVNGYVYTIAHFDYIRKWSAPVTKRITIDSIKPKFIKRPPVQRPAYQSEYIAKTDTNKIERTTKKKDDTRNVHIRTNGSFDIGGNKTGDINYNVRTGRFGIRTGKYTVIDSKGIHFSY